jgi:subtilisin-like proprotein convertase family protein
MRLFVFCQVLLLALCLCAPLVAQHSLSPGPFAKVPVLTLPQQDNDALRQAEMAKRRPGRPATFAVSLPVQVRPEKAGQWTRQGTTSIWYLRIQSPGAKTLNLGFSEFHLPTGAEFYISSATERFGPFTAADNEVHNQLWTPVIVGDELLLELRTPEHLRKGVQLYLTSVNHDFVDITKSASGACNLDVVCGENDGWGIVEPYRDIIRSVAAYTLNGIDQCTGFLINNANEDGRPLFMTANHCNVTANSSPSLVAYWNFENSFCRQPNSGASGGNGNGQRNVFNSGTIHLASFANSDVTITELDDPLNPNADAFFAGWSNEAALPTDTLIAVHHPGVDEKRISFSFQQARRVNNGNGPTVADGNLLEVPFWDIGTTEGGSSGSPIFDKNKRVRGQLFGGQAACGNQAYDVYGYFHVSWEGGGSAGTRLRDWLDPCGTGMTSMDGINQSDLNTIVTTTDNCLTACANTDLNVPLTLGSGFPAGSPVVVSSAPDVFGTSLSASTAAGGETVTLTISGDGGTPTGVYSVTVTVGSGNSQDDITLVVNFTSQDFAAPTLSTPANGSTDVSPTTLLSWSPVANAESYDIELAADENFETILGSGSNITTTSAGFTNPLPSNTTFYWRIRAVGECGASEWSTPFVFTTADISCANAAATGLPVTIPSSGTPTVAANLNVAASLLIESMEVSLAIAHSFAGDLSATLTSPDGTTVNLFNQVNGGACSGSNLQVVFTDQAAQTSADFENACTSDNPAVSGTFQSAEALSAFNGENAVGNWVLRVTDNADFDGGSIIDFEILFCTSGGGIQDYGLTTSTSELDVCQNEFPSVEIQLGNAYGESPTVSVDADGTTLTNVTTDFNPNTSIMTVNIEGWNGLNPGSYDLTMTVTATDGTVNSLIIPLQLALAPGVATLVGPDNGARTSPEDVTFDWDAVGGTNNYTLQYSFSEDFSTIEFERVMGRTSFTLDLPENTTIYWRVLSNNDCGTAISEVRILETRPLSLQSFGVNRSLNIYPNPVRGLLNLEASGNWTSDIDAMLLDATGRQLRTFRIANPAGTLTQIDLSGLSAGVYYLRLVNQGIERTERLVVMP